MGKIIEGDSRMWLVVNTAEYNDDGQWAATSANLDELDGLGFDVEERERIERMSVSEVLTDWDYSGLIVVRLS